MNWPSTTDDEVLSIRPAKNRIDPWQPYAFLVEPERTAGGTIEDVMTIFLSNHECPFRCTMCDLWQNTLDERVPLGAIPAQIEYARNRLPPARQIKLYNAGNFFDSQAIPTEDHSAIATALNDMKTVIVENHPKLTDERCLRFRDLLQGDLEVALGLETIHPEALASLNKRMTVDDFDRAVRFLTEQMISVRVFVLLNPPGLFGDEGIEWALRSLIHAIQAGARCVSLIPTRSGNGLVDQWKKSGRFKPPTIRSMEIVLERGLEHVQRFDAQARIFMDLWDAGQFYDCPTCSPSRCERIRKMNLTQEIESPIACSDCS